VLKNFGLRLSGLSFVADPGSDTDLLRVATPSKRV